MDCNFSYVSHSNYQVCKRPTNIGQFGSCKIWIVPYWNGTKFGSGKIWIVQYLDRAMIGQAKFRA